LKEKQFILPLKKSDEKYGRYLASIYLNLEDTRSVNDLLIEKYYTKVYNGEAKVAWTEDALNRIITG
jgi:hypothetical protein